MNHYTLEWGSYYMRDQWGNILLMTDQVALAFAIKDGYLLKHGSPEGIFKWWKRNREVSLPLFGELAVATLPPKFSVEAINKALDFKNVKHILDEMTILEKSLPGV